MSKKSTFIGKRGSFLNGGVILFEKQVVLYEKMGSHNFKWVGV